MTNFMRFDIVWSDGQPENAPGDKDVMLLLFRDLVYLVNEMLPKRYDAINV